MVGFCEEVREDIVYRDSFASKTLCLLPQEVEVRKTCRVPGSLKGLYVNFKKFDNMLYRDIYSGHSPPGGEFLCPN